MIAPSQQSTLSLAQAPMPQDDADRKREMSEAWKAYRGKFQDPLKVEHNKVNDNVKPNRCRTIVDKGVSFLFGPALKIQATDEAKKKEQNPDAESPIQDFLDQVWGDEDDRMTLLAKIAMNGGNCGQTFVKVIPPGGTRKIPRIVNLNPQNIRIVTDPEDSDLHLAYIIEYPINSGWQKRQIIARVDPGSTLEIWGDNDPDDTWTITNYQRRALATGQESDWRQVGDTEDWAYPFPPIFTCQNLPNPNEPWGIADLTDDLIHMNKVLIFIQSNISRILKYHAHPKTVAKGLRLDQLAVAPDDTIVLQSPDADIKNLEMSSDLSSSLNFASEIRADMDEQSRVPAVALGRLADLPKGNISGVALQLLFQPLLEKTVQKRRLYGKMIREVTRAALVLAGLIPLSQWDSYQVDIHWPDLLPIDDLAAAQTALLWKQLGVSEDTLLQSGGFDPGDEAEKSANEAQRDMNAFGKGQGAPPPLAEPGSQTVQQDQQQQQKVGMSNE